MRYLIVVLLGISASAPAAGQAFMPLHTDYFRMLGWIGADANSTWRGTYLGDWAATAGGAHGWGAPWAGSMNLIVHGRAQATMANRTGWEHIGEVGATARYRLSDNGAAVYAGAELLRLGAASGTTTAEINAGIILRAPAWLPERLPLLTLHGARNIAGDATDYARAGILLDYKFGVTNSLVVNAGHAWSQFNSSGFRSHGTDLNIHFLRQTNPAASASKWTTAIAPYMSVIWVDSNPDPNLITLGARVYWTQ